MNRIARRVGSNFFWLVISDIFLKGAMFIGSLYIARVLEPTQFGIFSFAVAISNYMWIATDLGIGQYGVREVARDTNNLQREEILSALNSLRFFIGVMIFCIFFLTLTVLGVSSHERNVLLAAGVFVIAYSLNPEWFLRGIETIKYIAIGNLLGGLAFPITVLYFVRDPGDTVWAALLRSLAFIVGGFTSIYLLLKKLNIKFQLTISFSAWKQRIKELNFFSLSVALGRINPYIPIVILGLLASPQEVGIYSAPDRIMWLLSFNYVFARAFYPILASLYKDIPAFKKALYGYQKVIMAIGLPIAISGTILAQDIILLLYGSSYIEATNVFKILIWLVPLAYIRSIYSQSLLALGLEKLSALSIVIGVIITVTGCLILIPIYGIYGAAIAHVTGGTTILLAMGFAFSISVYKLIPFDIYFLKVCIASVFMGLVITTIDANVVVRLVSGLFTYGILILVLGITSRKEILNLYTNIIVNRKRG